MSSTAGRPGVWTRSSWTTCSSTAPASRCTPAPGRSRCWLRGITTEGKPVSPRARPGRQRVHRRLERLPGGTQGRGLRSPLLIISDGAGGLINAAETSFARSLRQRCLIHRARNLLAKVPTHAQGEVKAAYWQVFDTDDVDLEPGPQLVALVQARIDAFAEHYRPSYPRQSSACLPTASSSPPTCASRPSTTKGSATPTSSSAPSARPADG